MGGGRRGRERLLLSPAVSQPIRQADAKAVLGGKCRQCDAKTGGVDMRRGELGSPDWPAIGCQQTRGREWAHDADSATPYFRH